MTTNLDFHAIDMDAVISQVARTMTAAEPTTDMRARVLGRIDAHPSRAWWRWMPLLTFTASLVIVAGTWALWPRAARPAIDPVATTARGSAPAPPVTSNPIETAQPVTRMPRVTEERRVAQDVMSEAELAWHARAVPALAGPAALVIDPLERGGVTIAPLEIQPLVTEPLTIRSIGTGSEILK